MVRFNDLTISEKGNKAARFDKLAEEIDAKLEEFAKMYNATVETLKKQLGNQLNSFAYSLLQDKVIEFIKSNNNI